MSPPRTARIQAAALEAGCAIARLADFGRPERPPHVREIGMAELEALLFPGAGGHVAVFADLTGAERGRLGICLSRAQVREFLLRLVGHAGKDELDEGSYSALCEVGNIAVSAAAGALGQMAGGIVVPSIPRLAHRMVDALGSDTPERSKGVYLLELELGTPEGSLRLPFVWIPSTSTSQS